ncbi:hypothetical protein [Neisseria bacilliformis]|uniref:hypothetical protein n=1 Tax=Neisseria bacilliformis TaxID=267212 RepID=UPI0012B5754E|nr:hypothetical protein [Neisseria bacilliformis]QMT46697.1 hypothetical protein H3L91_06975 [Neisseria bacilliformis]
MAKFGMTLIGVIPVQAGILRDLSNGLFFQELSNIKQDFRLRGNDGVFWVSDCCWGGAKVSDGLFVL